MSRPAGIFLPMLIGCLLTAMIGASCQAGSPGTITGVKLNHDKNAIIISTKGPAAVHMARVVANANRLILEFDGVTVGEVPRRIVVKSGGVRDIRVGQYNSRTKIAVEFENHPVPPFELRRRKGFILVVLGNTVPNEHQIAKQGNVTKGPSREEGRNSESCPSSVPALAPVKTSGVTAGAPKYDVPAGQAASPEVRAAVAPTTSTPLAASHPIIVQTAEINGPPSGISQGRNVSPRDVQKRTRGDPAVAQKSRNADPGMVREVRPPVTPPTPDPRLLVQEITELKFVQVGHNTRLLVRGGDNLDYRINRLSPTKLKIDLINAEIPKAHQKPLKTDVFSTSVELIVPGSQTIFVQLKDAVAYQVEKKKGVLMVDFPPPRLAITPDQTAQGTAAEAGEASGREEYKRIQDSRGAQRTLAHTNRIEQIRKNSANRQARILDLHKEREQLVKKRGEIEKQYEITPDPEVFNKLVTIDFQGISLRNAFRLLAEQAGINIIVSGDLYGTTTLRLSQVPLGQVIDTILTTNKLDREIIGNVMRVGPKKDIQGDKDVRQKQKIKFVLDIDKRVQENEKRTKDLEKQTETAMKEIEKEEAPEEPPSEDPGRVETAGIVEKINIDGKEYEFLFRKVKLSYTKPSKIVNVLDCFFNQKCEGGGTSVDITNKQMEDTSHRLQAEGVNEYGWRFKQGMGAAEKTLREERANISTERGQVSVEQAKGYTKFGGSPKDMEVEKLRAHRVLWPYDEYSMIFIKDTPDRIDEMIKFIAGLDLPETQVLIESRIVRAAKAWARGLGITWGGRNNQQGPVTAGNAAPPLPPGSTASPLPYNAPFGRNTAIWGVTGVGGADALAPTSDVVMRPNQIPNQFVVNLPAAVTNGYIMGLAMQFGHLATDHLTDLDVRLSLGEHAGKAKTVGRPKIQVLDNEQANIKRGLRIAFTTFSPNEGSSTQWIDVPLELRVKPKVFPDGRIQMKLGVTDNSLGGLVNGSVSIETREATTTLIVKDGDTAVIGGVMSRDTSHTKDGWPALMNVPLIGHLFSSKSDDDSLSEVLIFINPTIIKRPPPAS